MIERLTLWMSISSVLSAVQRLSWPRHDFIFMQIETGCLIRMLRVCWNKAHAFKLKAEFKTKTTFNLAMITKSVLLASFQLVEMRTFFTHSLMFVIVEHYILIWSSSQIICPFVRHNICYIHLRILTIMNCILHLIAFENNPEV